MSGNLIVVSAPSGGGKTSLVNAMLAEDPELVLSVSFTTREPRPGEVEGRDYHFVDRAEFEAMLERGEFLECAEVHGNRYGTSQKWIEDMRACGKDVVLEIDWQGAQQVRRLYPSTTTIFILPPSMEELERRLRSRAQDSNEVIRARLSNAVDEISHSLEFDYVIINNTFDEARRDLAAVVRAARLTLTQQIARNPNLLNLTSKT
jgi:guanylate kinase